MRDGVQGACVQLCVCVCGIIVKCIALYYCTSSFARYALFATCHNRRI